MQAMLEDVEEAAEKKRSCHFLGTIMLIPQKPGVWEINDGQQRVVTFLLICAWLCRAYAESGDDRTVSQMLQLLFDLDNMHKKTLDDADNLTPRVTPPSMDQHNFLLLIRGGIVGANGKMTAAWDAIEEFFNAPHRQDQQWQEKFTDFLLTKLLVVEIEVDKTLDPNAVFEVLNYRGKHLEDVDLIKNHIFSFFNASGEEARMETVERNMKSVYAAFRDIRTVSSYVRCHLQMECGFLRGGKNQFYPDVKKRVAENGNEESQRDLVFDLTAKLAETRKILLFQTITRPSLHDDYLEQLITSSGGGKSIRNIRNYLGDLRGYSIAHPAIFALLCLYAAAKEKNKKSHAKFANKGCQFLSSYLQRVAHTQGSFRPSSYEVELAELAQSVGAGECASPDDFLAALKECPAADLITGPNYTEQMKTIMYRSTSKAKYILARIVEYQQRDIAFKDAHITVEHVLPKGDIHHIAQGWAAFNDEDRQKYTDRLGNLTILHRGDNKPQEKHNRNFAAKKPIYERCSYKMTTALCDYDDWTPKAVEKRQAGLAKIAAEIWNFK